MFRPVVSPCAGVVALALFLAASEAARADTIASDFGPGGTYQTNLGDVIGRGSAGRTFAYAEPFTTPSIRVTLSSISLALGQTIGGTGGTVNVSLATDNGGVPGTILETIPVVVPNSFASGGSVVTANSVLDPLLGASTRYWVEVSAAAPTTTSFEWALNNQGVSGLVGTSVNGRAFGVATATEPAVSVQAIPIYPEPNTLVLLGAGLGSLLVWRRRFKQKR